jgi:hypothetical protein
LQEASLLSRLAATQRTWVQRLGHENKGGLPYIPFRVGYRNGGAVTACLIHRHMLFNCHFNLWGEVTLLWSHHRCYSPTPLLICFIVALVKSPFPLPSFLPQWPLEYDGHMNLEALDWQYKRHWCCHLDHLDHSLWGAHLCGHSSSLVGRSIWKTTEASWPQSAPVF